VRVPNIFQYLADSLVATRVRGQVYPLSAVGVKASSLEQAARHPGTPCRALVQLVQALERLVDECRSHSIEADPAARPEAVAQTLTAAFFECGFSESDLELMPWSLRLLFKTAMAACQECPPDNLAAECYATMGRFDMAATLSSPLRKGLTASYACKRDSAANAGTQHDDADGLEKLERESNLRFGEDERVHEVCRMLRSSRPNFLYVAPL
jgi:hypothetical protein